jgi:biopolymer transport protein ExbD
MTWSVRHAGSPRSVVGLTTDEVVIGLTEGRWETTDEIRGPDEAHWRAIEEHPQFAEIAFDLEPLPTAYHPDETRLDMNPLIDVALVLLIFFILTTTYETIRKVLDMPGATAKASTGVRVIDEAKAKETMIFVTARMENGQPKIEVEKNAVAEGDLTTFMRRHVRDTKKLLVLIDAAPEVEWNTVAAIMDAARGAGITKTLFLDRPKKSG